MNVMQDRHLSLCQDFRLAGELKGPGQKARMGQDLSQILGLFEEIADMVTDVNFVRIHRVNRKADRVSQHG